jgi:hypothetical protein
MLNMGYPKAYEPGQGYKYQLLLWDSFNREYDHLDYATDTADRNHLLKEYRMSNHEKIKVILLPQKYWK